MTTTSQFAGRVQCNINAGLSRTNRDMWSPYAEGYCYPSVTEAKVPLPTVGIWSETVGLTVYPPQCLTVYPQVSIQLCRSSVYLERRIVRRHFPTHVYTLMMEAILKFDWGLVLPWVEFLPLIGPWFLASQTGACSNTNRIPSNIQ